MFMLCFFTKLQLIKVSTVLESISIYTNKSFDILVVFTKIGRYREVFWTSRVLIVKH